MKKEISIFMVFAGAIIGASAKSNAAGTSSDGSPPPYTPATVHEEVDNPGRPATVHEDIVYPDGPPPPYVPSTSTSTRSTAPSAPPEEEPRALAPADGSVKSGAGDTAKIKEYLLEYEKHKKLYDNSVRELTQLAAQQKQVEDEIKALKEDTGPAFKLSRSAEEKGRRDAALKLLSESKKELDRLKTQIASEQKIQLAYEKDMGSAKVKVEAEQRNLRRKGLLDSAQCYELEHVEAPGGSSSSASGSARDLVSLIIGGAKASSGMGRQAISCEPPKSTHVELVKKDPIVIRNLGGIPDFNVVSLQGGKFSMGTPKTEKLHNSWEESPHNVEVKPFKSLESHVTRAQWIDVMGRKPALQGCLGISSWDEAEGINGMDLPANGITALEADEFAKKVQERITGSGLKAKVIPSKEAEYLARLGPDGKIMSGPYPFPSDQLGRYAVYADNSGNKVQKVKSKLPIGGVYDARGLVYTWTSDLYNGGPARVIRGGSFASDAGDLRSGYRGRVLPSLCYANVGVRLVFE